MTDKRRRARLEAIVEDDAWVEAVGSPDSLLDECGAAAERIMPDLGGAASVLFTDDSALRRLNAAYRGKDAPTNVLAFPAGDAGPGGAPDHLGDIALARETCAREAAAAGKAVRDHAAHLVLHGLLHLIGYDHETDEEADEMETMEVRLLAEMGVADPYREAGAARPGAGE